MTIAAKVAKRPSVIAAVTAASAAEAKADAAAVNGIATAANTAATTANANSLNAIGEGTQPRGEKLAVNGIFPLFRYADEAAKEANSGSSALTLPSGSFFQPLKHSRLFKGHFGNFSLPTDVTYPADATTAMSGGMSDWEIINFEDSFAWADKSATAVKSVVAFEHFPEKMCGLYDMSADLGMWIEPGVLGYRLHIVDNRATLSKFSHATERTQAHLVGHEIWAPEDGFTHSSDESVLVLLQRPEHITGAAQPMFRKSMTGLASASGASYVSSLLQATGKSQSDADVAALDFVAAIESVSPREAPSSASDQQKGLLLATQTLVGFVFDDTYDTCQMILARNTDDDLSGLSASALANVMESIDALLADSVLKRQGDGTSPYDLILRQKLMPTDSLLVMHKTALPTTSAEILTEEVARETLTVALNAMIGGERQYKQKYFGADGAHAGAVLELAWRKKSAAVTYLQAIHDAAAAGTLKTMLAAEVTARTAEATELKALFDSTGKGAIQAYVDAYPKLASDYARVNVASSTWSGAFTAPVPWGINEATVPAGVFELSGKMRTQLSVFANTRAQYLARVADWTVVEGIDGLFLAADTGTEHYAYDPTGLQDWVIFKKNIDKFTVHADSTLTVHHAHNSDSTGFIRSEANYVNGVLQYGYSYDSSAVLGHMSMAMNFVPNAYNDATFSSPSSVRALLDAGGYKRNQFDSEPLISQFAHYAQKVHLNGPIFTLQKYIDAGTIDTTPSQDTSTLKTAEMVSITTTSGSNVVTVTVDDINAFGSLQVGTKILLYLEDTVADVNGIPAREFRNTGYDGSTGNSHPRFNPIGDTVPLTTVTSVSSNDITVTLISNATASGTYTVSSGFVRDKPGYMTLAGSRYIDEYTYFVTVESGTPYFKLFGRTSAPPERAEPGTMRRIEHELMGRGWYNALGWDIVAGADSGAPGGMVLSDDLSSFTPWKPTGWNMSYYMTPWIPIIAATTKATFAELATMVTDANPVGTFFNGDPINHPGIADLAASFSMP